jgi:hypothetical protein
MPKTSHTDVAYLLQKNEKLAGIIIIAEKLTTSFLIISHIIASIEPIRTLLIAHETVQLHPNMMTAITRGRLFRVSCLATLTASTTTGFSIHPIPSHSRTNPSRTSKARLHMSYDQDFENLIEAASLSENEYVLGGDFAGKAATFNPADGTLIDIPDYLIPKALIEWGQAPKCLDVLVSEDIDEESLARSTITVLPDTGCSIDNLETVRVNDDIDLSTLWGDSNVVALQYSTSDEELRVETIFGIEKGYRMRVVIDLVPHETVFAIQSPMALVLERRTSASSSGGTIAEGGLDGRTVSILLGERLRKSATFAGKEPLEECYESEGIQFVSLPGNVSIAYGWLSDDEWVLQVGHILEGTKTRRVVSRQFGMAGEGELNLDVESWEEEVAEL